MRRCREKAASACAARISAQHRCQVIAQFVAQIAALLHEQAGQTRSGDGSADARKAVCRDGQPLERIVDKGIKAQCHNDDIGTKGPDPRQCQVKRRQIIRISGAACQRQVQVIAQPAPRAPLMGMPQKNG